MAINIKNEGVVRDVEALSKLVNESLTEVIGTAIRERLERVRRGHKKAGLAKKLLEIGEKTAPRLKDLPSAVDCCDSLYDQFGLPR